MANAWTLEDENYLEDNFGKVSLKTITSNLNRTESAVMSKACKIGVTQKDNANWYTLADFCQRANLSRTTVQYWIDECGFPTTRNKKVSKKYIRVYPDKFWEWAETNKHRIQWTEFPKYALDNESNWVDEIRKSSKRKVNKRRNWSNYEIVELKRLLNLEQYTYPELTEKLDRSHGAIKRKIYDLRLPVPLYVNRGAAREYRNEEIEEAVNLYEKGYPMHAIAKNLNRTEMGLRGKLERSGYKINGKILIKLEGIK